MPNSQENLKEKFIERYNQLKASELLLDASINLLRSINSEEACTILIQDFISRIPEYNAYSDDMNTVKRVLLEVSTNQRDFNVALAELNYLYDVACYKQERMCLMSQEFKCYF